MGPPDGCGNGDMGERRKAGARREPVFDVAPADEPKSRGDGGADEAPKRPRARSGSKKSKGKRGKDGGGGRKRGLIGGTIYWGAVGALWLVIAAIGVTVWIGAHLPPIQ